jgi:hypothetical protein
MVQFALYALTYTVYCRSIVPSVQTEAMKMSVDSEVSLIGKHIFSLFLFLIIQPRSKRLRFEVLTVVKMSDVFQVVTPHNLVGGEQYSFKISATTYKTIWHHNRENHT